MQFDYEPQHFHIILQSPLARLIGTPIDEQVGFITHCSEREHTLQGTMGYLSENIIERACRSTAYIR